MGNRLLGRRDAISSLLSSIQIGSEKKKTFVEVLETKEILGILKCLESSGFIRGFKPSNENTHFCTVYLKYSGGVPVIRKLVRVSRSSKRVYVSANQLKSASLYDDHYVISTTKGYVCTVVEPNLTVGGELVFRINGQ